MKPSMKWAIGLTLTAVAIGTGIYFYNKSNAEKEAEKAAATKPDNLSEQDWNDMIAAAVAKEKATGKSNAISILSTKPILLELAKQQFLNNGTREQYDTLMTVIKSDKNDPDSVSKSQTAILNFISSIAASKQV